MQMHFSCPILHLEMHSMQNEPSSSSTGFLRHYVQLHLTHLNELHPLLASHTTEPPEVYNVNLILGLWPEETLSECFSLADTKNLLLPYEDWSDFLLCLIKRLKSSHIRNDPFADINGSIPCSCNMDRN